MRRRHYTIAAMSRRVAALLLLATAAAAQDAAFRQFFDELRSRWPNETISETRTILIKEFKKYDRAESAEWLLSEAVAKDDAADVVRQALAILSGYKTPGAREAILQGYKRLKDGERKQCALRAVGANPDAPAQALAAHALRHADPRWVIAGLDAVAVAKLPEHKPAIVALLKHRHPAVRTAAIQTLLAMRAEAQVPDLFRAFCAETSHRARYEAWRALTTLLREPKMPFDPKEWEPWYRARGEEAAAGAENPFAAPFPAVKGEVAKPAWFFKIPVFGDRICFVLDVSLDMDSPWTIDIAAEQKKTEPEQTPGFFSVKTRWQLVRAHVRRCLELLPESTEVAFVFFSNRIRTFPEDRRRFLRNSPDNRAKILEYLEKEVERVGSTDMYEAFRTAWGFLADGNREKNFERGAETILFVTDGLPAHGEMKNRPDRLRDEIWLASIPRRLRVHCVGIHNHAFDLLKNVARDTGGLYVHVQAPDDPSEPQDLEFWPEKKKAFEEARKPGANKG
jgi:hypothetical protein